MITPIFRLDRSEEWRPQPVETAEQYAKIDGKPVDLAALPAAGGWMDFPDMEDPEGPPVVGYHRAIEGAGLWWHQFWLWYLYNPKTFGANAGKHEGDWEFVQLGCVDRRATGRCCSRPHSTTPARSGSSGAASGTRRPARVP
jgi:hypothetical protein